VTDILFDENVDPAVSHGLSRIDIEAGLWCIGDPGAPQRGTPDPDILVWCEDHDAWLVTHNRASMPVHLADHIDAGRHIPGIFIFDRTVPLGEMIELLALISQAGEPDDYTDQIRYLPQSY
jgi:hypothetical protein